ncbi:MAG TPA: glutamate racemase [Clostridiales bacterium]|jgi:glutamate racemase|nr:glutamate racemase [Clostridiales bacterium]
MDNRPIGILDTGVGGLTALDALVKGMPNESFIYFGDSGRMPYGDKSPDEIVSMTRQITDFLRNFDVKLILYACGTISITALPVLRKELDIPVLGVVEPAATAAVQATKNRRVGVIATAASIAGGAFEKAISEIDPRTEVISMACPKFAPMVENGRFAKEDELVRRTVSNQLEEFKGRGIDTLLLGCTHYLLLAPAINEFFDGKVSLVSSGHAAAKAVISYLEEKGLTAAEGRTGSEVYYTSGEPEVFAGIARQFLGRNIDGALRYVPPFEY